MYGQYLHDGLGAIPGARYAGESLRIPKPAPVTGTAHGGTLTALYGLSPRIPSLIYGRTPTWEIEGHQVDPFYDVRGNSGLGQVRKMPTTPADAVTRSPDARFSRLAVSSSAQASAPVPAEAPAAAGGFELSPLLLAALAAGAYFFFFRKDALT